MHYASVSGCPLSSNWLNEEDNLGTNAFCFHPQGFEVFLNSAQVVACGAIHVHMKK